MINSTKSYFLTGLGSAMVLVFSAFCFSVASVSAEQEDKQFETGEKLAYTISFKSFQNAGFAELFVVSNGSIGDKKAVEIRGRVKSSEFVSSAFYLLDNSRTVFASADSGLPLYHRTVSNAQGLPEEEIKSFLETPATQFDLITMLYKARQSGGAGTFSVLENDKSYSFDFAATGGETVETAFETFETTLSTVTSSFFEEVGVTDVRVNFTTDENKVPVRFRFKTKLGGFDIKLASRSVVEKAPEATNTPTPTPARTPRPTPQPSATPAPYKENQPLPPEFPFALREKLDYSILQGGRVVNKVRIEAEKRVQVQGNDTLVLKASVLEAGSGAVFAPTDNATANVDPETLVPSLFRLSSSGPLAIWSHEARFSQSTGRVAFGRAQSASIPIGTHSLLSLAYAIRSFNISLSRNKKNPVNDTRVSLFLKDKPLVLTLRPAEPSKIKIGGEEVLAERITIITGDRNIDRYRPKLWLSVDARRLPLAFEIGSYRAELIR